MFECTIKLEYPDEEMARSVYLAVKPDDDDFVSTELKNNHVLAFFRSDDAAGMRRAVDDFLACVSLAEKSIHALDE